MTKLKNFFCPLPWKSLSVDSDGTLRLCCHDPFSSHESLNSLQKDLQKPYFKNAREQFLKGEIPKSCLGCFQSEQETGFSPRLDYINRFGDTPGEVALEYLDLTINNQCNLACRMCEPKYSQLLEKDFKRLNIPFDSYKKNQSEIDLDISSLKMITLTGGEPFLGNEGFDFLSSLKNTSDKQLRIYSNLMVLPEKWKPLLAKFKEVEIFISMDGVDQTFEYIRYPGKFEKFKENLETLLNWKSSVENLRLRTHSVLMAYNLGNLRDMVLFLDQYKELPNIGSFTFLEKPKTMMAHHLPEEFLVQLIEEQKSFLESLKEPDTYKEEWRFNKGHLISLLNRILVHKKHGDSFQLLAETKRWDIHRSQNILDLYPQLKNYFK